MKKLFKIFVAVALSLFVGGVANAQIKVGANFGAQLPLGDNYIYKYRDKIGWGFGGNINGEYFTKHLSWLSSGLGLSAGYYTFKVDEYDDHVSMIPVTVTGNIYFRSEGFKPYIGGEFGAYILGATDRKIESNMYWGAAAVIGFQYDLTKVLALNFNLKSNHIFSSKTYEETPWTIRESYNFSSLGANIGLVYTFGGSKSSSDSDE